LRLEALQSGKSYPEGFGEVGEFGWGGIVGDGTARGSDVFGAGLGTSLRPLGSDFVGAEFAVVDLAYAAQDGLRIFLADFGDGNTADFYGVLQNGRFEIGELIQVRPFQKMQMQDG
jgi:hypothetical protein